MNTMSQVGNWSDWPEFYGQCFVYDHKKDIVFVGNVEDGYRGKICLWNGGEHYLLWPETENQFLFQTINWPMSPTFKYKIETTRESNSQSV